MFDDAKASYAVRFIEMLKLTGDFHGQPFALMDWQRKVICDAYGTLNERGVRQYKYVYLECAKKNAKSMLTSAVGLLHLYSKSEQRGQIAICAGDRHQAATTIYEPLVEMIEQNTALEKRVRIIDSQKYIENKETGTTLQVLSAEAYTKHGWNLSLCIFDELHAQPNRALYDVMMKGSGLARRQPMWWFLTTSGDDPDRLSIAWEVHEKAEKIIKARAEGDQKNNIPTWYPVIYSYNGEDIWNEENWKAANPSLGVTLQIEDLRELAQEAQQHPADERLFRWLNLCQWPTTKLSSWMPLDLFDATIGEWGRGDLLGLDCYMGGDFSTTTDLSAVCLVFPPQEKNGKTLDDWRVIWDCWIPSDSMQSRIKEDRVPYDQWAAAGWIMPTEGNQIDYDTIEARIWELAGLYNIYECGFDLSFATMLTQHLQKNAPRDNWVVEVPQQYAHMTDPMNTIEILLRQKRTVQTADEREIQLPALTHEDNPVARWCFGNASISKNGNAQIKLVKERKGRNLDRTKRIDLMTAWVNAMARAKNYASRVDLNAVLDDGWGM